MPKSNAGSLLLTYQEDENGLVLLGTISSGTPETTASLFAPGAIVVNNSDGRVFKNSGTSASPVWVSDPQLTAATISSAQFLALNSAPVTLVAAPGDGKMTVVDRILFTMTRTATAYTSGGALEFRYTNGSGAKVSADIAASVVTTGGAGTEMNTVGGVVSSLTPVENAAIVVTCASADFADGTGTATVVVIHRTLDV